MPKVIIDKFGRGLDSTTNPSLLELGYSRQSQNMLHNRGDNRAELRDGITRVNHTRAANSAIFGLYEFINNAGTTTRLVQTNSALQTFSLTPGSLTSLDAGHQNANISRFATFLNFFVEADHRDNNYIGNGSAAYPYQVSAPAVAFTATPTAGGALTVGTYQYDYARYSSTTTEISPAYGTAVPGTTAGANLQITLAAAGLTTTEQFDQVKIYRTKVGTTGPYYLLTTDTVANFVAGIVDNTADASLTTLSTIHTAAGASKTTRVEAATDVVLHRGRLHWLGLSGQRSRQRWTQLLAYECDSTTDARHDLEPDDGDFLWRGFSVDGTLVLMKDHSIHLMNGDVDEKSFTWQVQSDKDSGIGCYCPFTAVATPVGIIFQGECGVYVYRPGQRPIRISKTIQDTLDGLDYSRRLLFEARYNPCERVYILSVTPQGATTNTESYAYFIDTGYWSKWPYGTGSISPSCGGLFHNSSSNIKSYFGTSDGYIYETDTSGGTDGPISGTTSGTATGGSTTSIEDSAASFYTTGNGLTGQVATKQLADNTYESKLISSNTGTALTTSTLTAGTASGDLYFVGAIEGILSLGRVDFGEPGKKHVTRITFEFQQQSHSINVQLGYTLDNDTEPTTYDVTLMNSFTKTIPVNTKGGICVGIAPYVRIMGTNCPLELIKIEIEYYPLLARQRE